MIVDVVYAGMSGVQHHVGVGARAERVPGADERVQDGDP